MRKLLLNVDALDVESFEVAPILGFEGGTVFGHSEPNDAYTVCGGTKCMADNSVAAYCPETKYTNNGHTCEVTHCAPVCTGTDDTWA